MHFVNIKQISKINNYNNNNNDYKCKFFDYFIQFVIVI